MRVYVYMNWSLLHILCLTCAMFLALAAAGILRRWDWMEGLRAISDVRAVSAGIQRPVPGGDGAVLSYRLPHTASHTQSHHQLCGLLLQHTQSLVPHWTVPGLARLLGIETRHHHQTYSTLSTVCDLNRDGLWTWLMWKMKRANDLPKKEKKQSVCFYPWR